MAIKGGWGTGVLHAVLQEEDPKKLGGPGSVVREQDGGPQDFKGGVISYFDQILGYFH